MRHWVLGLALAVGVVACSGPKGPENALTGDAAASAGNSIPDPGAAAAPAATAAAVAAVPAARFAEVTIPSGTALRMDMQSAIGSDTSAVEQAVRAELRDPVLINGRVALPAGTEVTGVVTDVERAGKVKGRARIAYRFTTLRADGQSYDIKTAAVSHLAPATKGSDAKKIAIGAGAGAALGALLGGGDGAAKGAAIGGAGGTGVVLATRGQEVHVAPGANVTARLTAPVTVRVRP